MPPDNRDRDGKFQPGLSGNPGGRPKAFREYQDWLRENCLPKAKDALVKCLESEDEKVQIMAVKEVSDRLFGKAPQSITGPDGGPLQVDAKELYGAVTAFLGRKTK